MGSTQNIFYYIMLPFTSKAENIKERLTSLVSSVFFVGGGLEVTIHGKYDAQGVCFLNSQAITGSLNFEFLTRRRSVPLKGHCETQIIPIESVIMIQH